MAQTRHNRSTPAHATLGRSHQTAKCSNSKTGSTKHKSLFPSLFFPAKKNKNIKHQLSLTFLFVFFLLHTFFHDDHAKTIKYVDGVWVPEYLDIKTFPHGDFAFFSEHICIPLPLVFVALVDDDPFWLNGNEWNVLPIPRVDPLLFAFSRVLSTLFPVLAIWGAGSRYSHTYNTPSFLQSFSLGCYPISKHQRHKKNARNTFHLCW